MRKLIQRLIPMALCLCMLFSMAVMASSAEDVLLIAPAPTATQECALKAGAGAQEIVFPDAMFPVEGFSGEVHLNPYVRVLVLEQGVKAAIVSYETVNVPSDVISMVKEIVSAKTGVPADSVWVHATHAITTPHAPDDSAKRELFVEAMTSAAAAAAEQAATAERWAPADSPNRAILSGSRLYWAAFLRI